MAKLKWVLAALLASQTSTYYYQLDATGVCAPEPATGYGTHTTTIKSYSTGNTTSWSDTLQIFDDGTGAQIGSGKAHGTTSTTLDVGSTLRWVHTVTCKGTGQIIKENCTATEDATGNTINVSCQ